MSGSDLEDAEPPAHILARGGLDLVNWRLRQLEIGLASLIKSVNEERAWRFLVTGGIGVGSAFITWALMTFTNGGFHH